MLILNLKDPESLPIKLLPDGKTFSLTESVRVNIGTDAGPIWVEIQSGYVTDLASIPPELGILGFEKMGRHSYAALVHDWMFDQQVGYELCNAAFYSMLRTLGVRPWKSAIMAFFCQAGGKGRYKAAGKKLLERRAAEVQRAGAAALGAIQASGPNP